MNATRREVLSAAALALAPGVAFAETPPPLILAEFGVRSSDRLAHDQAIDRGADFLVVPIVAAKDGALIVAPDVELSAFTNIASRAEFADRRRQAMIGGRSVDGWLASDFSGSELRSLISGPAGPSRGRSPIPAPTLLALQDVIDIARAGSVRQARVIGICPRLVHPAYFAAQDLALEGRLTSLIRRNGYNSAAAAMIVMSSEPSALKALSGQSGVRRIQEIHAEGGPIDSEAPRFQAMAAPEGLSLARSWASAVAPDESLVIQPAAKGAFAVSGLAAAAHAARLAVFPRASGEAANLRARLTALFLAGTDGVLCEDVGQAARARAAAAERQRPQM
jgi:glycerophosphoryl diester phosphodiesterase